MSALLAAVAAACGPFAGAAEIDRESAELEMRQGLGALLDGRVELAMKRTSSLVRDHSNFRLGRLMYADLLAVQAHQNTLLAAPGALGKTRVRGLVEEAQARALYREPSFERLPGAVMQLSGLHRYAFVLDAARSRLYLFSNRAGTPEIAADYYVSTGNGGVGKTGEGDEKTPLGVYHLTSRLADEKLPELYGAGAYPLNYPNKWDRLNDRHGSGIWLHGTPRTVYSRPPRDSRGCVVLSNRLITALSSFVDVGRTPVVLSRSVEWLEPGAWRSRRESLLEAVRAWRLDWQSLDIERYLGHYSRDYRSDGQDYAQMAETARRNARKKTFVEVGIEDLDLFEYPGEKDTAVAVFDQNYRSNDYRLRYRKQQFWRRENGRWMIIFEDRAETAPPA